MVPAGGNEGRDSATVLVVDDDPIIQEVLADLLADEGYVVQRAANGAEALAVVRAAPPKVILLDMMMPVMDGTTFVREYLRLEPHPAPVVVLTASRAAAAEAARLPVVRDVVQKPFDADALLSCVRRHARHARHAA